MKSLALLSLFLLCGCSSNWGCRQNAYAQNSHVTVNFGSMLGEAVDPPRPHQPLDEMLAACETPK